MTGVLKSKASCKLKCAVNPSVLIKTEKNMKCSPVPIPKPSQYLEQIK